MLVLNQWAHKRASQNEIKNIISPGIFQDFGYIIKLHIINNVKKNAIIATDNYIQIRIIRKNYLSRVSNLIS